MDTKVLKIIVPCIIGILGIGIGYVVGSSSTSKKFLKKQREVELAKKEIEYTKADSLYLITHPVWKKHELKSHVYSTMFDDIRFANIDKLKKHSALDNPYWQEINILFDKLSPYCAGKVQSALKANSGQNEVHLCQLYNDLQKTRTIVITEISGIDAQPDTAADRRLCKLEEKDLIYLQNNNIWDEDSIWSQKYINFMIGMLSGNSKVFMHTEINNDLWQDILSYKITGKRMYKMYNIKDTILKACDKQSVNIIELHALVTQTNNSLQPTNIKLDKPEKEKHVNIPSSI